MVKQARSIRVLQASEIGLSEYWSFTLLGLRILHLHLDSGFHLDIVFKCDKVVIKVLMSLSEKGGLGGGDKRETPFSSSSIVLSTGCSCIAKLS